MAKENGLDLGNGILIHSGGWKKLQEAAVDPGHDGNMLSFYYHSRLAITLPDGGKVGCETMRAGCPQLSDADGHPGAYSYYALATSPDHARR